MINKTFDYPPLDEIKDLLTSEQRVDKPKIALVGEMGTGKTHFVRALLLDLYPELDLVSSPTFVFRNVYVCRDAIFHHYDLYRVRDFTHLEDIGFWESMSAKDVTCLIEWADIFPEILNEFDASLRLEYTADLTSRRYTLELRNS